MHTDLPVWAADPTPAVSPTPAYPVDPLIDYRRTSPIDVRYVTERGSDDGGPGSAGGKDKGSANGKP